MTRTAAYCWQSDLRERLLLDVPTGSKGSEADIFANVTQIRLGVVGAVVGAIPEPGTYSLMVAGLASFGLISRRRKAKK